MEEVKKSIFKQSEKKKLYKKNYYRREETPYVDYYYEQIGEHNFECNLSMPLLQRDEKFYIEEEDKTIQVAEVIRTSKDNVLYICYADIIDNDELYKQIKAEVDEEIKQIELKKQENSIVVKEEVTGFRKFIKYLFKL